MDQIEGLDGTLFNESSDDKTESKIFWTDAMTTLLIKTYNDFQHLFNDGKTRKNVCWNNVAIAMLSCGYRLSGENCNNKWRSLKRQFGREKRKQHKTGNEPSQWLFFDQMNYIVGSNPEYAPIALSSNLKGVEMLKPIENTHFLTAQYQPQSKSSASTSYAVSDTASNTSPLPNEMQRATNPPMKQEKRFNDSMENRQVKRRERKVTQQAELVEQLRQERSQQFERTYQQRERYMQLLEKFVPKTSDAI